MARRTRDRWNCRTATLGALVSIACLVLMVSTGGAQPVVFDVEATRDRLIAGTTDLANLGRDMVVADFNGDGIDDVAVSAPRDQSPRGITRTGRVSIFFGGEAFTELTDIVRVGRDGQTSVEIFGEMNDRIGRHMAAGDLNGDTFADLVITAQADPGDGARLDFENEKVYVIFGAEMMTPVIQMPGGANVVMQRNLSHINHGCCHRRYNWRWHRRLGRGR